MPLTQNQSIHRGGAQIRHRHNNGDIKEVQIVCGKMPQEYYWQFILIKPQNNTFKHL